MPESTARMWNRPNHPKTGQPWHRHAKQCQARVAYSRLWALAALLVLSAAAAYGEELTRDEKIEKFGSEAEAVYHQIQAEEDPEKRAELEKRLDHLVSIMNELGIPTQEQAEENREYWILRSHYAEQKGLDEGYPDGWIWYSHYAGMEWQDGLIDVAYDQSPLPYLRADTPIKFWLDYSCWIFGCDAYTLVSVLTYNDYPLVRIFWNFMPYDIIYVDGDPVQSGGFWQMSGP